MPIEESETGSVVGAGNIGEPDELEEADKEDAAEHDEKEAEEGTVAALLPFRFSRAICPRTPLMAIPPKSVTREDGSEDGVAAESDDDEEEGEMGETASNSGSGSDLMGEHCANSSPLREDGGRRGPVIERE